MFPPTSAEGAVAHVASVLAFLARAAAMKEVAEDAYKRFLDAHDRGLRQTEQVAQERAEKRAIEAAVREDKADHRAHEALERERRAEQRAISAADREVNAERRAVASATRETNAEQRAVDSATRETNAERRAVAAEKRSITASCLGWASLTVTALTFATVVYYTALTKSMADSARQQVSLMADQQREAVAEKLREHEQTDQRRPRSEPDAGVGDAGR
jgi:hypothetical protein